MAQENFEETLNNVNTYSRPSDLRITDMRFVDITGAPMHCTLLKLYTNQGLVGFGEVRDAATKTYALMLKRILLGENPCNVDKLFRRIKSKSLCGIWPEKPLAYQSIRCWVVNSGIACAFIAIRTFPENQME
jgi:L-alanine-DL-glutamate epimerase-like enolase superfamily enzyme